MKMALAALALASSFLFCGLASASLLVAHDLPLYYDNGSYVVLPSGTYTNLTKVSNVWYLDGYVYPSPTPTVSPTPTSSNLFSSWQAWGIIIGGVIAVFIIIGVKKFSNGGTP